MKQILFFVLFLSMSTSLFSQSSAETFACMFKCSHSASSDMNSQDYLCCLEDCLSKAKRGNTTDEADFSSKRFGETNTNSLIYSGILIEENAIYPNPVKSNAQLTYLSVQDANLQVSITNTNGIEQINQAFFISAGEGTVDLNMSQLSTGVYFVRVSSGKYSQTIKVKKY